MAKLNQIYVEEEKDKCLHQTTSSANDLTVESDILTEITSSLRLYANEVNQNALDLFTSFVKIFVEIVKLSCCQNLLPANICNALHKVKLKSE